MWIFCRDCDSFVGGELFSHVQGQGGGMQEGTARVLFRQIVSGLDYMHVRLGTQAVSVKDRKEIESPQREKEGK